MHTSNWVLVGAGLDWVTQSTPPIVTWFVAGVVLNPVPVTVKVCPAAPVEGET